MTREKRGKVPKFIKEQLRKEYIRPLKLEILWDLINTGKIVLLITL